MTNGDKIRAMSEEALTILIGEMGHDFPPYCDGQIAVDCDGYCMRCCLNWLKREAEDGKG